MRKVVTSQEVTHLWAHRRQPEARNGGNTLYFKGDTIYSYGSHFPIARHLPDGKIAFTTDSYRQTTAGHMSLVRRAIPSSKTLVFVHNPCMTADRRDREMVESKVIELLASAAKRRSEARREDDQASALSAAEQFNAYAEAVGSAERVGLEPIRGADLNALRRVIVERDAAKRAAEAEAERRAGIRLADDIAAWKRGDPGVSGNDIRNAPVALRWVARLDGGRIETSRGAEIPVDDAKRLWPFILRVMGGERDYDVGMSLGHYQLTKIRRDGSIVVGCHDIAFAEIERIALALGLAQIEVPA